MTRVADLIGTFVHDPIRLNRLIKAVEVMLVILLAVALARLAADLIWDAPLSNGNTAPATSSLRKSEAGFADSAGGTVINTVSPALSQLFGMPDSGGASEVAEQQPLQPTSLNLTLKGILADTESDNRLALISAGGGKEQVYRLGQKIEGAEIIRIESRRVVIRRNGVNEALDLEVKKLEGQAISRVEQPHENISSGIRKLSDTDRTITRNTLKQQMNNLPSLLQQATAVPYNEGGEQKGFRIVDLKKGSVFEQLGIQQNDIIYAVNGTPVRNTEEALSAYRMIGTTSNFMIGILRNGQDLKLNLAIQ